MTTDRLRRACGWVDARLSAFKIDRTRQWFGASVKAVAELAHGADCLLRASDAPLVAIGRTWMDHAWAELDGGELIREIIAKSPHFAPAAAAFLPFFLSGYRNEMLRATLASQVRRAELGPLHWTMMVPVLRLFEIELAPAMEEAARVLSVLHGKTLASAMPQDAAYILIHECLYASSWGRHALRCDEATTAYLAETLPALVEIYCELGDADSVAELILASHCAGRPCESERPFALLAESQTAEGNLVAQDPNSRVTVIRRFEHPRLARTYHTTLAAIMAWSVCPHRL